MNMAPASRLNWRWIALAIAATAILVFVSANTHLVYVAFTSQPDCVSHIKEAGGKGDALRAAESAC